MMIKEIVIASRNSGKINEIRLLLSEFGIKIRTIDEFKDIPDIIEDGETFEENAIKKAEQISNIINLPVIADDSGLVVDVLNGDPGIYSARYAGPDQDDYRNNEKLLEQLRDFELDKRTARFVCVMALAIPGKNLITTEGTCEGLIGFKPEGLGGFGYDPLFYLPEYNKTMAEVSNDLKNTISHRAKAIQLMIERLAAKESV